MSERGSFVTQFIYCPECYQDLKTLLEKNMGYGCLIYFGPMYNSDGIEQPIIAGRAYGGYPGEELQNFELFVLPAFRRVVCEPVRIAIIGDTGEKIFTIEPMADEEKNIEYNDLYAEIKDEIEKICGVESGCGCK